MGGTWSWLFGRSKDERAPIEGLMPRLKNIARNNFRGIFGIAVPLLGLAWRVEKGKSTLEFMWLAMIWIYLLQPLSVPTASIIPIFLLPMTGLLDSVSTCRCYFNEGIALFTLTSMLILLLNNSGYDRRLALNIMCSGDNDAFAAKRLLIKCSLAAFILSMLSNRLIVTSIITQYVTPIFLSLKSGAGKGPSETNYDNVRYVINNAIQTSSAIGSTAIMHSAYCTHAFRTIFIESCLKPRHVYPDIFNYLQYSVFALPLAIVLFIANCVYHIFLLSGAQGKPMSAAAIADVKSQLQKHKDSIPKQITSHEVITIFCLVLLLVLLFVADNKYVRGWSTFNYVDGKPIIKDPTIVSLFVILLHSIPRSTNFLKLITENRKSKLTLKPDSSILFWRFVNMNTNYSYFMLIGAGVAIGASVRSTKLYEDITNYSGTSLTNQNWYVGLLLVCFLSCILANIMTGVAAVVIFLPFVLNMARDGAPSPWVGNAYLAALGVGTASSFGFMWPFMYTPAFICHHVGKVPMQKMAKYSIVSVVLCCIILWVALIVYAPILWDPTGAGIYCEPGPVISSSAPTTPAPGGGGDEAPPPGI
ncbi:unnamed protein product [Chilo suppressalis]|uniref:Citrate transporter-like domain-containing protein n=1 Tax=Chilo suppressalis TaxID=168631 RepID=A0ABN8AQT1_CHISP|nr:hypothetical protein evm_008910 [Chilo suppressalis]CAH0397947.1 unnamed protein product [Chilo suppressalis]